MEDQLTSISWPMVLRITGLILLFLAMEECTAHFSFDGDNNPDSNYTNHFCFSGLFVLLISFPISSILRRRGRGSVGVVVKRSVFFLFFSIAVLVACLYTISR